jgi:hypothetical protein
MSKNQDIDLLSWFQKATAPRSAADQARAGRRAQNCKRGQRKAATRAACIAVLDMETDPFDNVTQDIVFPFLAVLYTDETKPVVIWEEDHDTFVDAVIEAILALPDKYTIYAHNGGKFDFMFLIHKLRGKVSFKGRGIMSAAIGPHTIRDSFHIIPEKLANLQKDDFDYNKLVKGTRDKHRKAIIDYCISDCRNLLFYVKKFVDKFGFKISIGAAALAKLRENYEIESITETTDEYLRQYFFGGRVQCLNGAIRIQKPMKLYDINSAYPNAMANILHPIGSEYIKRQGQPNENTAFIKLFCKNNGALMGRDENNETNMNISEGVFYTTIHEYNAAIELNLISNILIMECVDCLSWSNFSEFVIPYYEQRAAEKSRLKTIELQSMAWNDCNAEQIFLKLLLNNAYGKTAQNPRRFREHWLTDPGDTPPDNEAAVYKWELEFSGADYWVWSKPSEDRKYLNVGTGASITGAVRAKLMHAIHNAVNPVYCDTDSIICEELNNTELHPTDLGAWDLEKQIADLVICGKKLYAYRDVHGVATVRAKGVTGLSFDDMCALHAGGTIKRVNKGPTLTRYGSQNYITRAIKSTARAA